MNKKLINLAVAATLAAPLFAVAEDSPHSFSGNFTLASEYLYRGIAQTAGKPALQGGFDYAHSSGFYAGIWGSNISWLENAGVSGASLEVDIYGGFKGAIANDLGFDVGVLTYNYPGSLTAGATDPDTTELYGALSWKFLTLKYSQSTTNLFGTANSKNSSYLELNAAYDLGGGWGVNGHVGHQKVKNNANASYTDWKVGATKDVGFGTIGVAYSTTNAQDSCTAGEFYCVAQRPAGPFDYEAGKGRLMVTFGKTF